MDAIIDIAMIRELTVSGILLVGIYFMYREVKDKERKLDKKDKLIFRVLDKTSEILDKVEDLDDRRKKEQENEE